MGIIKTTGLTITVAVVAAVVALLAPPVPKPGRGPAPLACDSSSDGAAVQRFAKMIHYKTLGSVSTDYHILPGHQDQFEGFLNHLKHSYPLVYEHLKVEQVGLGGWSLLYTWKGQDQYLRPVLYVSHYDVVPVAEGTEGDWTHGPFTGKIVDGVVWGRGALDVKFGVAAIMEAVSELLKEGFTPQRTMMITFGHDEELGGNGGAKLVAELLHKRGVELDVVVDEGGFILADGLKGMLQQPLAMVGTAEKMYTSAHVTVRGDGGHSSAPPINGMDVGSQAGRLLTQISKHPPPVELKSPVSDFLQSLAPHVTSPILARLLSKVHIWPLSKLVAFAFSRAGAGEASMVRTTCVATKIHAGVADNVLPITGDISFNCRHHPETPQQEVLAYIQAAAKAARVNATVTKSGLSHMGAPNKVTPAGGRHFQLVKRAIQELWRGDDGKAIPVVPYLMSGGTDSKHFAGITKHGVLRFVPYAFNRSSGEIATVHSTNERARVTDFHKAICTYKRIMQLLAQDEDRS